MKVNDTRILLNLFSYKLKVCNIQYPPAIVCHIAGNFVDDFMDTKTLIMTNTVFVHQFSD